MPLDTTALAQQYREIMVVLPRFLEGVRAQLLELLKQHSLTLGVPLEARIKSWESIRDKINRLSLDLDHITSLQDLVGFRMIFLFSRDLDAAREIVSQAFTVVDVEDTSARLTESQFGYQSYHYIAHVPHSWLSLPTFADCDRLACELQLRTMAQHIWAAASHHLQYKREESVPQPIRRAIHRVSALLETVDLEFSRVLESRDEYREQISKTSVDTEEDFEEELNVELVAKLLDEMLPLRNKDEDGEDYGELLRDLNNASITTTGELKALLTEDLDKVLETDKRIVNNQPSGYSLSDPRTQVRLERGVFYTHVGLVRAMLEQRGLYVPRTSEL